MVIEINIWMEANPLSYIISKNLLSFYTYKKLYTFKYGNNLYVLWHYISMYYLDNRKHTLPHIHVKFQDEEAVISIIDGGFFEGTLIIN
jgi:hypothetical protein